MENKKNVFGCDVAKTFIVLSDGNKHFRVDDNDLEFLKNLVKNSIVVIEQTGSYGVRWAYILSELGAKVFIADGKEFKAYRMGRSRKKDDYIDAFYLRKFFLDKTKKKYIRAFNPQIINIRALIRQHIRNDKDITKYVSRLLQYLAVIFPRDGYYKFPKRILIKELAIIEDRLKASYHTLSGVALSELKKLKIALQEQELLEQELKSIAKNHKDYEILKTFPGFGDLLIATLIAYYWDINNFKNVDSFIGYVLMGANLQQSGKSIYEVKTDKARTEVKGKFFNLFRIAHRNSYRYISPYYPLTENLKSLVSGGHNMKKRFIKFMDNILRLVYTALKYRLSFEDALIKHLISIEKNINNLKKKIEKGEGKVGHNGITKNKAFILYRLNVNFETYKKILEILDLDNEKEDIKDKGKGNNKKLPLYLMAKLSNKDKDKPISDDIPF